MLSRSLHLGFHHRLVETGPVENELYLKRFYGCKNDGSSQPQCHSSEAICCKLGRFQCCLRALPCASSRAVPTSLPPRKATRLGLCACEAQLRNSPNKPMSGSTTSGRCCRGRGRRPDCTSGTSSDSLPRRGCGCDASSASPARYGFLRSSPLLPVCSASCANLSSERPCPPASLGGSTTWVFTPSLSFCPIF